MRRYAHVVALAEASFCRVVLYTTAERGTPTSGARTAPPLGHRLGVWRRADARPGKSVSAVSGSESRARNATMFGTIWAALLTHWHTAPPEIARDARIGFRIDR